MPYIFGFFQKARPVTFSKICNVVIIIDAFRFCKDLNSSIQTTLTLPEIDDLFAQKLTDTMDILDGLIEDGQLNQRNIDYFLGKRD